MARWRYDATNYKVGDDLWLSQRSGWSNYTVSRFIVSRITPKGRLSAKLVGNPDYEITVLPSGRLLGEGRYNSRSVVSADTAAGLIEDQRRRDQRRQMSAWASDISSCLNRGDDHEARDLFAKLSDAFAKLPTPPEQAVEE